MVCSACGKSFDPVLVHSGSPASCPECHGGARRPEARASQGLDAPAPAEPAHGGASRGFDSAADASSVSPSAGPADSGTPFGRYRLLESLGTGGMGQVWKAWDTVLRRMVALKLIKPDDAHSREVMKRFEREARLAGKLRHPNIVAVHDFATIEGQHCITMDFVQGRTLQDLLDQTCEAKRQGSPDALACLREQVATLATVATAVGSAHENGVIHRDLKPGNILLDARNQPFVTDFGLAKQVVAGGNIQSTEWKVRRLTGLTLNGQLLGTPAYMSPEQADGNIQEVGAPTDIWALGVILYEILTGRRPFDDQAGPFGSLIAIMDQEPVPPAERNRLVPATLEAICLKALSKDPRQRQATAAEFAESLRRWLRGESAPTGGIDRTPSRSPGGANAVSGPASARRSSRVRIAIAAVALALLLTGSVMTVQWLRARAAEKEALAALDRIREVARTTPEDHESILRMIESSRPMLAGQPDLASEVGEIEQAATRYREVARVVSSALMHPLDHRAGLAKLQELRGPADRQPARFLRALTEAETTVRREGIRAQLKELRTQSTGRNPAFVPILANLSVLAAESRGMPDLVGEVNREVESVKNLREIAARTELDLLKEQVRRFVEADLYADALSACDRFAEQYLATQSYADALELRTHVKEKELAHRAAAAGDGMTEPSPPTGRIVRLLDGKDVASWTQLQSANGTWAVDPKGEVLTGENTRDLGATDPASILWILKGEPNWRDLRLSFEFRLRSGKGFAIALRVGPKDGATLRVTDVQPAGVWQRCVVHIRGDHGWVTMPDGRKVPFAPAKTAPAGVVGFGLRPGERVEFRDIVVELPD